MPLLKLHRYNKLNKIFINVDLISSIEPYPETAISGKGRGSKIFFQQADIPVYIAESCEDVVALINRGDFRLINGET